MFIKEVFLVLLWNWIKYSPIKVDAEHSLSLVKNWKITDLNKKKVKDFIKDYSIGKITGNIGNNSPASVERNLSSLN
jgi:hypothetical protein